MGKKASPTLIGIFVLGAVALFFAGILIFGTGKFFSDRAKYLLYFKNGVNGLQIGAPVSFRGVQIGNVTDIQLYYLPENLNIRIPVIIEIDLKKISHLPDMLKNSDETEKIIAEMVNKGLRAQLKLQSLVTGQLYVDFDFHPDKDPKILSTELTQGDLQYPELPTIPSEMEQIARALGKLPIEALAYKALDAIDGIESMINSTEMKEGFSALTKTMKHIEDLAVTMNREISPMAADARHLIQNLDGFAGSANRLFKEAGDDITLTISAAGKLLGKMESTFSNLNSTIIPITEEIKTAAKVAQKALDQANKTFTALEDIAKKETPMGYQVYNAFDEFAAAARSIRNLADYLERHPEALLQGKGRDK